MKHLVSSIPFGFQQREKWKKIASQRFLCVLGNKSIVRSLEIISMLNVECMHDTHTCLLVHALYEEIKLIALYVGCVWCNNIRGLDMCSIISVLSCNELTFMSFSNTVLQNNSFEILVHFKFLFAIPVKNSFLSKSKCLLSLKECFNFSKEKDFSLYSYENSQNILIPEKNCISSKKSRM